LRLGRQDRYGLAAHLHHAAALRRLLEVSRRHCFVAQALHRGHDVSLLGEKGVAEFLGPLQLVAHILQHPRERHQRLDAGSQFWACSALVSASPFSVWFGGALTQRAASITSSGYVEAIKICASKGSG
jgi:hypothetical protein